MPRTHATASALNNRDLACKDEDPELFFPITEKGPAAQAQIDEARAVCFECPARVPCLDGALDRREQWGVWGGTSAKERRVMLTGRRDIEQLPEPEQPDVDAPELQPVAAGEVAA